MAAGSRTTAKDGMVSYSPFSAAGSQNYTLTSTRPLESQVCGRLPNLDRDGLKTLFPQ